MEIPVLIEPVTGNGYRAKSGEPLAFTVEGSTRDEALNKLRDLVNRKLQNGSELTAVELSVPGHPGPPTAGSLDLDDPEVQAWIEAMAEYREEVENDPTYR